MGTALLHGDDLLTSRMAVSLAQLIESIDDVRLLPTGSTWAAKQNPEYDEFVSDFKFDMVRGGFDAFDVIVRDGAVLRHTYFHYLKDNNHFKQGMRHIVESTLPPTAAVVRFEVSVEVGVYIEVSMRWRTPPGQRESVGLVHNQVTDPGKVKTVWNNLRFRSHSEMRVAVGSMRLGRSSSLTAWDASPARQAGGIWSAISWCAMRGSGAF